MFDLKRFLDLDKDTLSTIGKASVVGLHMVSGVAVGGGIGWALDKALDTGPWLLLIFFVLGVAAGFRNVWTDTRLILQEQEREQARAQKRTPPNTPPDTSPDDTPGQDKGAP